MVTRVPALEFLHTRVGEYRSADGKDVIHLKRAGHGLFLQVDAASQRFPIYGLIGVFGSDMVLHSNIDLPNVMVFRCPQAFDEIKGRELRMEFVSDHLPLALILEFSGNELRFSHAFDGKPPGGLIVGTRPEPPPFGSRPQA